MPINKDSSDQDLIIAAQAGDRTAVGFIYDRYATFLFRWIIRRVDHCQEAEDLTAEIMIRMVKAMPTIEPQISFRAWLFGVARHVVADYWRDHYRLPAAELPADLTDESSDAEPADEGRLRAEAERVINELPESYREVLNHRFFKQESLQETALAMNTTVDNVKVLQHRALKKAAQIAQTI